MNEIEIKCKPFYVKVRKHYDSNVITFGNGSKFTKSRPKQEPDYFLYKFTKYYEIIPTDLEKSAFIKKHKWDKSNDSHGFAQFYKELTNTDDYPSTVYKYELDERHYNFVNVYKTCNWNEQDIYPYTISFADHIYIIKLQDGILLTDYTKAELKEQENKRKQEADYKVISGLLKTSIDNILIKYGMELKNSGIRFKNSTEYYKFVKLSLNRVIEELQENGYNVKLNPRVRSIKYSSIIVDKKDLRLKNEDNE